MSTTLLSVRGLSIALGSETRATSLVQDVSFDVISGQILSIVGESGSGKSMMAKAIMGLLPPKVTASGTATFRGENLLAENAISPRGTGIGLVFQEPMTALTPVLTIATQLTEALVFHGLADKITAHRRAVEMLGRVGIPNPEQRMRQYPHELSGGMRQRVMIAMMMLLEPDILIADEPTTALDVTVQAQILDLLREIVFATKVGLILITHDMGVVAEMASDVIVMKAGRLVEAGPVQQIFYAPSADYTRVLLDAVPSIEATNPALPSKKSAVILSTRNLHKTFRGWHGLGSMGPKIKALDDVSLDILRGETLALVGESGSGKSTLGRVFLRLTEVDRGTVQFENKDLLALNGPQLRMTRRKIQMIFQDPYASLNPRQSVGATIAEPIIIQGTVAKSNQREMVDSLLKRVGLTPEMASRFPHEFSGGQRQRIAIARAIAAGPQLIIADEPTSALDVSIQSQILDLLASLKQEKRLTMLFISHDLAVVRQVADRVAVMRQGRILEIGPAHAVWSAPYHPYTKALIEAAPVPDPLRKRVLRTPLSGKFSMGNLTEVAPGRWVAR